MAATTETQISAFISSSTKELVEKYADAHGVKKGHLVEEALLHHLQALRDLPLDVIIPPRVVVSEDSLELVAERLAKPRRPTKAMRDLMRPSKKRAR
jgi:hypothetical protein